MLGVVCLENSPLINKTKKIRGEAEMTNILSDEQVEIENFMSEKYDIDTFTMSKIYSEEIMEEYIMNEKGKSDSTILLVDVDNFTDINDVYGVKFSDTVLLELAELIKFKFPGCVVGRLGGDSFAVLAKNTTSEDIYEKAEKFNVLASELYAGESPQVKFTVSTAIVDTKDACSCYEILKLGKSVLAYIKSIGGGMVKTYRQANTENNDRTEYLYTRKRKSGGEFIEKRAVSPHDLVAYSMVLMENAKDIPSSINVLLRRIGREYNVDRVSITSVKWEELDFKYEYQWSRIPEDRLNKSDCKITIREYYRLAAGYDKNAIRERSLKDGSDTIGSLIEAAIYARGRYSGSLRLESCDSSHKWSGSIKRELSLLANLLGTYLGREEDDRELKLKELEMDVMSTAIKGGIKIVADDRYRTILSISDGLCELYGYTRDELLGIADGIEYNLIYIDDVVDVLDQCGTDRIHDKDSYTLKYRIKCKDGSLKWVLDYGRRVKDKNGRSVFYSTCSDVTEIEQSAEQIRDLYKQSKASEEFIRIALRNTKTAEFYYYPESKKCVFPERSCELLDCRSEYTNAPYDLAEDIVEPMMREHFINMFETVSLNNMTKSYSFKLKNSENWIKTTLSVMRDENKPDKIGVVVGIAEDISDETTAAQEKMNIINSISETYFAMYNVKIDSSGMITYTSMSQPKEFEKILGDRGEYRQFQKIFAERFIHNDYDRFMECSEAEHINETLNANHRVESHEYYLDYGTHRGWVRMNLILVSEMDNFIIAFTDINEEKKREEQSREEHRILSAAISDSYDRIYELNLDDDTIYEVNIIDGEIDKEKCHISYGEMIKYIRGKYIHEDDLEDYDRITSIEYLKSNLSFLKPAQYVELRFKMHENDPFFYNYYEPKDYYWKSIQYKLMFGAKSSSVMMFMNDIDERKSRELEIRQSLKDAFDMTVSANNAKGEFLSKMSHDIRTPMNAIAGMILIAKNHLGNAEKEKDCLDKIELSTKHLLNLINEVLDMSKIESGHMTLNEDEVNISDLVESLSTMLKPQIERKKHIFRVKTKDVIHENIIADSLRIQQVFVNLLSNAVKYTPDNGTIELQIRELPANTSGAAHFEFTFKDNGIGMSKEYQKVIFEPFTRAEDSRTSKIQGTGLGMAITKQIVNMMNGEITVKSEINKGTEFKVSAFFRIPVEEGLKKLDFEGRKILVVNDETYSRADTKKILHNMGIKVYTVNKREETEVIVENLHKHNDDLFAVIVDVEDPEKFGVDITQKLRNIISEATPIIIAIDQNTSQIDDACRAAGADCCIERPLFISRLTPRFKKYLNNGEEEESVVDIIKNTDFSGKRILLVEDNIINMEIAAEIISYTNAEIETAENGKEAVELVKNNPQGYFDMVLMDVQMPVMNGYEATAAIRKLDREDVGTLPIIACTANAFVDDIKAAKKIGMNGHLAKPIDFKELMRIMNKWLN